MLVVTAHPDDVDFGAAATVATWTAHGIEVTYCVCTSGEATGDPGIPREDIARLREQEQRVAAATVGVYNVIFLGYPDGRLTPSLELRRDITRVIRTFRPERVLTWSPEINWELLITSHPDHRAVGEATLAAVYPDARNPHAHPELDSDEGLRPWSVAELWLADAPPERRNHVVDVTDTVSVKIAALRSHQSQTEHMEQLEDMVTSWLAATAQRYGLADGRLAEAYQVVATA